MSFIHGMFHMLQKRQMLDGVVWNRLHSVQNSDKCTHFIIFSIIPNILPVLCVSFLLAEMCNLSWSADILAKHSCWKSEKWLQTDWICQSIFINYHFLRCSFGQKTLLVIFPLEPLPWHPKPSEPNFPQERRPNPQGRESIGRDLPILLHAWHPTSTLEINKVHPKGKPEATPERAEWRWTT
jgi:hypothetical protein